MYFNTMVYSLQYIIMYCIVLGTEIHSFQIRCIVSDNRYIRNA
jgi:hypothetical protein